MTDPDVKSNLIPGWGVVVSEDIEVDEPTAIQWLIEHNHREALGLNATKFKRLAKVLKPDFVKFSPKVYEELNRLRADAREQVRKELDRLNGATNE